MNVSVKDAGACRKTMKIEVPADALAEERTEILDVFSKHANLPGFRKGKAPKHIVASKYAKEIKQDLEERILPRFYHEALKESNLKVVNVIDVSKVDIVENEPLAFEVTVDVEPEFKLPKYRDIPIKAEKDEVTDQQVQEYIDAIRLQHATYEEVEGKTVEADDMAQLTYNATSDGRPLEEVAPEARGIGKGEGYWVSADEHSFLPGMGNAILGMKPGDRKDIDIAFPDDFMVKELAGVKAVYHIEVTAVRVRALPDLDEVFFERLRIDSVETLRTRVREELERQAEARLLNTKHDQIIEYLIKKTKLDVPESLVQERTREAMYDIAQQRMMAGMSQEQIAEHREEILKEAEQRALENVKLRFIGLGIAKDMGMEASDIEIDEHIATMAIRQRKDARTLRKELEEKDALVGVSEQIRFNKALDFMVENARVK